MLFSELRFSLESSEPEQYPDVLNAPSKYFRALRRGRFYVDARHLPRQIDGVLEIRRQTTDSAYFIQRRLFKIREAIRIVAQLGWVLFAASTFVLSSWYFFLSDTNYYCWPSCGSFLLYFAKLLFWAAAPFAAFLALLAAIEKVAMRSHIFEAVRIPTPQGNILNKIGELWRSPRSPQQSEEKKERALGSLAVHVVGQAVGHESLVEYAVKSAKILSQPSADPIPEERLNAVQHLLLLYLGEVSGQDKDERLLRKIAETKKRFLMDDRPPSD